jgi:hypothetical protein
MILVPLFDLKFLKRASRKWCRNFKSAALAIGVACAKWGRGRSISQSSYASKLCPTGIEPQSCGIMAVAKRGGRA